MKSNGAKKRFHEWQFFRFTTYFYYFSTVVALLFSSTATAFVLSSSRTSTTFTEIAFTTTTTTQRTNGGSLLLTKNNNDNEKSREIYRHNDEPKRKRAKNDIVNNRSVLDKDADRFVRRQLLVSMLATSASVPFFLSTPLLFPVGNAIAQTMIEEEVGTTISSDNIPIQLAPKDKRSYEAFTLANNGLRVILCSDPSSNTIASAMDVHVGATSDPDAIPGLAHFNEHMLFLGTKKYPQEDSFERFLSSNGGSSNAFTDSEDTVYYFSMNMEENDVPILKEGLDRFASFFISPLFTEGATGRELNAIESENTKNLQSDVFRLYQIEKSRANSLHPYSKFFTGNKATLLDQTKQMNINLRDELIKFWKTYYSAPQMSLAVIAPQPIPVLKQIVEDTFKDVPTTESSSPPEDSWGGKITPFLEGSSVIPAQKHVVEIVPVADLRQVSIVWPIVYDSKTDKESRNFDKPDFYVSHLLGHEGPNSLLSYLKKQGWVNGLGSSTDADLSDFYTFEVTAELTRKGLTVIDKVVEAIFSYIQMMRERNIPRYVFEEVLQLGELEWRFLTKGDPASYAQSLVKGMQDYPKSLYVAGPRRLALRNGDGSLLNSNKPRTGFTSDEQLRNTIDVTSSLASKLTVDNALITVISKSFDGKTSKKEKWYGTNYNVRPVPAKTLKQWSNCASASALGISYPLPNMFIPSEQGLRVKLPIKDSGKLNKSPSLEELLKPISPPLKIRDDGENGRWTVYFKQDDRFGQPKAYAIFQLLTEEVYSSPKKSVLADLYQICANDYLTEYTYDAALAGLSFDVQILPRGVRLTFAGYNDKLMEFASYVSSKLSQDINSLLPKDDVEFERYKDRIIRALAAFDVQQPYSHAIYYSSLLFQPKGFLYTNAERREAIQSVTLLDLREYVKVLWKSGKGEALLQGNIDKRESLQFVDVIDKTLAFNTISNTEIPSQLKAMPLPLVKGIPNKVVVSEPNSSNKNAASHVSVQCLQSSEKDHVLIEVLSAILSEPFYEDLRTKQQLGYIVSSGVRAVAETRNLSFICQSSVVSAEKITAEILKFIDGVKEKFLEPLTSQDVSVYTKGLIRRRAEPDKKLSIEVSRNWNEIATSQLQFDRIQNESQALRDIAKEDIIQFWDNIVLGISSGRRILVSETIPQSGTAASKAPPKSTGFGNTLGNSEGSILLGIDDIDAYRSIDKIK